MILTLFPGLHYAVTIGRHFDDATPNETRPWTSANFLGNSTPSFSPSNYSLNELLILKKKKKLEVTFNAFFR